jgi:Sigma-70, region 4
VSTNVIELVAELPTDERHAVEARVVHERSYREIAAQLHCSEMVVRKRVSRGLGRRGSPAQAQRVPSGGAAHAIGHYGEGLLPRGLTAGRHAIVVKSFTSGGNQQRKFVVHVS